MNRLKRTKTNASRKQSVAPVRLGQKGLVLAYAVLIQLIASFATDDKRNVTMENLQRTRNTSHHYYANML
jgi:hypothetical protein